MESCFCGDLIDSDLILENELVKPTRDKDTSALYFKAKSVYY